MRIDVTDEGVVMIDAYELLTEHLTDEARDKILGAWACTDGVIEDVIALLTTGRTESTYSTIWSTGFKQPLEKYREEVLAKLGAVQLEMVRDLMRERQQLLTDMERYRRDAEVLRGSWPFGPDAPKCPKRPAHEYTHKPTDAELRKMVENVAQSLGLFVCEGDCEATKRGAAVLNEAIDGSEG